MCPICGFMIYWINKLSIILLKYIVIDNLGYYRLFVTVLRNKQNIEAKL